MNVDKTQFGLTEENDRFMTEVDELDLFSDQTEAAKFAMSLAINRGVELGSVPGANTKWHSRGFDKTGEIADLIRALYPDTDTPYRAVEFLVNRGLEILREHIRQNRQIDLASLLDSGPAASH